MINKLRRFQENDSEALYHIAKYLYFNTSFFFTYLTQIQLQTIDVIFNSESLPKSDSKRLWSALIDGKLLLKSVDDLEPSSTSSSHSTPLSNVSASSNPSNLSPDTLSEANILNCKSISLRMRSLLWSKATSYYYHLQNETSLDLSSARTNPNNDVFLLLHEDDDSDYEDATSDPHQLESLRDKTHISSSTTNVPTSTRSRALNSDEDDNYDDDDDDDYDEDEKDSKIEKIDQAKMDLDTNNTDLQQKQPVFLYYKDYIILDIIPRNNSTLNSITNTELENEPSSHKNNQIDTSKINEKSNSTESSSKPQSNKSNLKLISTKMSTSLNTSDTLVTAQEQKIIQNLNSVYHSFENDRETLIKRQKLEANDKLIDEQDADESVQLEKKNSKKDDTDKPSTTSNGIINVGLTSQLSMNIGSTNLSLKYLLKLIDTNKEKVPNLTPRELRNLIHDVKKTKSKWSSDDKIGQEELYEAAEKVVLELRAYTQHSTPFLTRVSKREAPNYYSIIKDPMDLNTVIKKLKNLEYKSKQSFVADLMLIWSNCLAYNTDPNHQLRKDAIAMKKKTLSLLPLIPDIVIRTRAELEKEEKKLELKKQKKKMAGLNNGSGNGSSGLSGHTNVLSSSKKGVSRTQGIVRASTPAAAVDLDDNSQPENSQEFTSSYNLEDSVAGTPNPSFSNIAGDGTSAVAETTAEMTASVTPIPSIGNNVSIINEDGVAIQNNQTFEDPDDDVDDVGMQIDLEKNGSSTAQIDLLNVFNDSNAFNDEDSNDLESQVWNNYTSKLRGDFLLRRSKLFVKQDNKSDEILLNADSEAVLRDPARMAEVLKIVSGSYHEEGQLNFGKKSFGDGDDQIENSRESKQHSSSSISDVTNKKLSFSNTADNSSINENSEKLDDDQQQGNDLHLTEYDVINGIPLIGYRGVDDSELTKKENDILESLQIRKRIFMEREAAKLVENSSKSNVLGEEFKVRSDFLPSENGLNSTIIDNISQMQEIRKICFKILLIRQMQQNQVIHHTQMKPPQYAKINDLDLDAVQVESESIVSEHKSNGQFVYCVLRKNVCKLLMNTGFEGSDPYSADLVTQLAETFMSNLICSIKLHLESVLNNRVESIEKILLLSLMENGVGKPNELCTYVKDGIFKQNQKLKDLKHKLSNFLKELLRPSLMSFQSEKDLINEKNFGDNSDQFLTGDFSNELGEDFFGFRELGLDKEFRMLSSSIPLHLLNSKLSKSFFHSGSNKENEENFIENFDREIKYEKLHKEDIEDQIKLIQPFLHKFFDKSKAIYLKNYKNNNDTNDKIPFTNNEEEMLILEDEDLPQKQRNIRPRILPNGKISGIKKKTVGNAFFLDEDPNDKAGNINSIVSTSKKGTVAKVK